MNAQYMKVAVTGFHNGQMRLLHLHVVQRPNKGNVYFLFDFYGYAIDNHDTIESAVKQFQSNQFTVLDN